MSLKIFLAIGTMQIHSVVDVACTSIIIAIEIKKLLILSCILGTANLMLSYTK